MLSMPDWTNGLELHERELDESVSISVSSELGVGVLSCFVLRGLQVVAGLVRFLKVVVPWGILFLLRIGVVG